MMTLSIFQLIHRELYIFSIGSSASKEDKSAKCTANTCNLGEMAHTEIHPNLISFSIPLIKNRAAYGFFLLKHMKHRTWKCALLKNVFLSSQTRWCTSNAS